MPDPLPPPDNPIQGERGIRGMTNSPSHQNPSSRPSTVSRRDFLRVGLAGAAAAGAAPLLAEGTSSDPLAAAAAKPAPRYLTPPEDFTNVGRGYPVPSDLPEAKRRAAGLDPETWTLEVVADPASDSKLETPLSRQAGTALNWAGLMKLAEKHAVRYLKVMTCNNIGAPLGMGLWEGVPLREVLWLTRPVENIRHVFYYGYHNDDPKQIFQSWLPVSRALEDPPGHLPVLVCYKLNGQWLSPKRGGPVRMLVPEAYGFKSVKWLQKVLLTNRHQSDDTYANGNNDTNSWLKTYARFDNPPEEAAAGRPILLAGRAQVGLSGLAKVQYWVRPEETALPANDSYFATAPWQDAEILPLPAAWWRELPDGKRPEIPSQFDPATGRPLEWPLRHCLAYWAAEAPGVPAGRYELRCRTIDMAGQAQPLPRPFQKSGHNAIEPLSLVVKPA